MTPCCPASKTPPPLGAALRRHRQRQDAGVLKAHRAVSGAGPPRPRAGAGNKPDASDDPPPQEPVRAAGGRPALGPQPHRASAPMADDTGRRRRHRGGDAERRLRPAGKHRPRHHRRGAGAHLPLRVRAPVRRPRGGPAAGGGERLPAPSGQRYPQHRELLRRPEWPHPARPAHPALRRQPAAQRPDRRYAGRAGLGQPREISLAMEDAIRRNLDAGKADHPAAQPPRLPDHGSVRRLPRGAEMPQVQRPHGLPQGGP